MLGGIGLDQLGQTRHLSRLWLALGCGRAPLRVARGRHLPFRAGLRDRAIAHYRHAALSNPGADRAVYQQRAERQVRQTLDFLPRYDAIIAIELGVLAALAAWLRRSRRGASGFNR